MKIVVKQVMRVVIPAKAGIQFFGNLRLDAGSSPA
jgi:hypothetical protein